MPDITETGSHQMLCEDRGSADAITRAPDPALPGQAGRRDDTAIILTASGTDVLRELICADYLARPVSREVAP